MGRTGSVKHFLEKRAHFMLNLDKTCVMASDGNLRVIADAYRKKQEKIQMTTMIPLPL
jgi:hypothetical protein